MKYAIASLFLLSSCASILDSSKQEVFIKTDPDVAANCQISGSDFKDEVKAPGKFVIQKSYYPTDISCTPVDGGETGTVKVLSDVSNWGYGGAVLGVGIGAGVDTYTGAAFEYPEEITIKLGQTLIVGKTDMNDNVDWE